MCNKWVPQCYFSTSTKWVGLWITYDDYYWTVDVVQAKVNVSSFPLGLKSFNAIRPCFFLLTETALSIPSEYEIKHLIFHQRIMSEFHLTLDSNPKPICLSHGCRVVYLPVRGSCPLLALLSALRYITWLLSIARDQASSTSELEQ